MRVQNNFRQVKNIQIADIHYHAHGYFGLIGIGNIGNNSLPNPLVVSDLKNLAGDLRQVQNFYERVVSDMTAKANMSSITKTYLKTYTSSKGI